MTHDGSTHPNVDLRPLIARLKEIERKCDSMGSRNEEFPLMKERLASIIARLEAGEEPSGEPLLYRAMARELFPVAHLFESVGFTSVGKEINHVERALQELEPRTRTGVSTESQDTDASVSSAATVAQATDAESNGLEDNAIDEAAEPDSVPMPVVIAGLLLAVVIMIAAALVFEIGPFAKEQPIDQMPPSPTTVPSRSPEPLPTAVPITRTSPGSPSERLAEVLYQVQTAFERGDFDAAVRYLSIAELIDGSEPEVRTAARKMVDRLVANADLAADAREWEDAARALDQARIVADRFDLKTRAIDHAEARHDEMRRHRLVRPEEIGVLRESIGKRVEVKLDDGSMLSARIADLQGSRLVLDVENDVGGGVVRYVEEIALSDVDWVRVWVD